MPIVKTSAKGQVVIPAKIREKIGLKPGGRVSKTFVERSRYAAVVSTPVSSPASLPIAQSVLI